MEYDEVMNVLADMRSRFDTGFSYSDKETIDGLYSLLLQKKVKRTRCNDCYRDAFIEIYHYLKRTGKMPKKPDYILKAGIIIHPQGTNKFYANSNMPNDVAEEHLAKYPQAIHYFECYPEDVLARVEARKKTYEPKDEPKQPQQEEPKAETQEPQQEDK